MDGVYITLCYLKGNKDAQSNQCDGDKKRRSLFLSFLFGRGVMFCVLWLVDIHNNRLGHALVTPIKSGKRMA